MRSTILAAAVAVGGLAVGGGKADAQVFYPNAGYNYSYGYNYNPYTGAYAGGAAYGYPGVAYSGYNYTTPYGTVGSGYGVNSAFSNSYRTGYVYNPWTGRGASYNTFATPYGYGRTYYRRW